MNNEKLDNILNLAIDATPEELEKSAELNVGYDELTRTWQLIAKSSGGFDWIPEIYPTVEISPLLNGYAILTVPQNLISEITARPEIEYIEKPKRLFFAVNEGRRASCINPLQTTSGGSAIPGYAPNGLFGTNILVAVIDSGIDYAHPDFCNADGTTRIIELWDQTLGRIFDSEQINEALQQNSELARYSIVPSRDISGHGTHVAGICAGNGRASGGLYRGVAPESPLLIVKLATADPEGFPRTTELMLAVDYTLRKANELQLPVAVNISFGNNYGSHDGTSLLETYLNDVSSYWKSVIVTGTGNEGASRIHTSGRLTPSSSSSGVSPESHIIEFSVGEYEPSLNLQLWKSYADQFDIQIRYPDGTLLNPLQPRSGTQRISGIGTELLIYYGEPSPYSSSQEIYFDFIPTGSYITSGIWEIILIPRSIVVGQYDLWLPGQSTLSAGTGFLTPTETTTLTIPSTASKVISVGAYNSVFDSYASFSGRGLPRSDTQSKPNLVAPGVNITSCAPGGGYAVKSGTSMAAPFVTGSAALLMEWGIRLGNDAYLYGEKVKAYLQRGARALPGFETYPNEVIGYGALCLRDSLPE